MMTYNGMYVKRPGRPWKCWLWICLLDWMSSERRWRNSDVITTQFARMMSPWVNYVTIPHPQPLITAVLS